MAATKIKYKRIDLGFVKKNYPVLFDTIDTLSIDQSGISPDAAKILKSLIAGLCIEIALKSDGTVDLFEDDLPDDFLVEEEFN